MKKLEALEEYASNHVLISRLNEVVKQMKEIGCFKSSTSLVSDIINYLYKRQDVIRNEDLE